MNPEMERFERVLILTASLIGGGMLLVRAPIPTAGALITGIVAALVGRHTTVGALTGTVVLTLLLGLATRRAGIDIAVAILVTALVFWESRGSIRRLRRGEERQIGVTLPTPFKETVAGLWTPPSPHGLLGRSAMPLGAMFVILVTVALAAIATARLA
jgi:hypothetical protein